MKEKKPSKSQLEALLNDEVFVVRGKKHAKFACLTDRGISLTVTDDFAIVSTNFHRTIFNVATGSGYSKPYLFVTMFVDIVHKYAEKIAKDKANPYDVSLSELMALEMESEDKAMIEKVNRWFDILIEPLYAIGETVIENFSLYMGRWSLLARQNAMLNVTGEDLMFSHVFNEYISNMRYIESTCYAPDSLQLLPTIKEIEKEAQDKVYKFITDNGGEINDAVVLPAAPEEIVEAFNELKDNPNK